MTLPAVKKERLKITLTNQQAVSINEDEWPAIAPIDYTGYNGGGFYPIHNYHVSFYVREHSDGKAIVYCIYRFSANGQKLINTEIEAGRIIQKDEDVVSTIEWVAARIIEEGSRNQYIRENINLAAAQCIKSLPPRKV